ncbi:MAG TPA: hypothetical protein VN327_09630 [Pseudonocardiaceae bacterium]|jgi:hypothetical protein|nr:hypothetical protein [Pseudonocardiaceae bacterium]
MAANIHHGNVVADAICRHAAATAQDAEAISRAAAGSPLGIAVGTALAGGPPRRSQRAELPHWAPASGTGVKARFGEGVHHAGGW